MPEEGYIPLTISKYLRNGKPPSKNHGRIIDESKIKNCECNLIDRHVKTDAPTIIDANTENKDI